MNIVEISHYTARYGSKAIPKELLLQDWGVSYRQMEPYHHLFEQLFGVSGKAGNIEGRIQPGGNPFEAPRRGEYAQQPLESTRAGELFADAARKLGYHPFPTPAANSSGAYTNPDGQKLGACQYCGHCERFICEASAKASPQLLLYPMLRQRPSFSLRPHTQVLGLNYDRKARRVSGVRCLDLQSGEHYLQPADVVVLSAFVMTNTKLLLLDGIGRPYEPATGKGVVGRNFCYQPNFGMQLFLRDAWTNPFLASGSTAMTIDDFNNDNFDHAGLGFLGGGMISANMFGGRPIRGRRLPPGTPLWGTAWKQANTDWYAHSMDLNIQGSSYPHRANYLDLDPTYKDAFGLPLVRMTFDWQDNDQRMQEYVSARMTAIAEAVQPDFMGPPAIRRAPFDTRIYQSTHITGGTPMGADPASSAVSPRSASC